MYTAPLAPFTASDSRFMADDGTVPVANPELSWAEPLAESYSRVSPGAVTKRWSLPAEGPELTAIARRDLFPTGHAALVVTAGSWRPPLRRRRRRSRWPPPRRFSARGRAVRRGFRGWAAGAGGRPAPRRRP